MLKLNNLVSFIADMNEQVYAVRNSNGKFAMQWRKDLANAKAELSDLERSYELHNYERLTLEAYAEKHLSSKWV